MVINVSASKAKYPLLQLVLLCAVFISTASYATTITVTSSRNPVALDDSFHIIYEADSSVDDDPDFTPVYRDFDVLSSSQSTRMRSINGNWTMKKSWDLAVIAKNVGKFTIPPIRFGKDQSPAIQITVTSSTSQNSLSPDGSATVPAKIFLETTIDKNSGWVQAQFLYTIRLFRTVSISGASLTQPEVSDPDAIVQMVAEDQYQTTRNGIRYDVIERRYAIFPQKSGQLKINPITFEGRINDAQPRTIFDQLRMSGQLKRLRSNAVSFKVRPAPADINLQDWLPASNVQVFEEWSNDLDNIKAGEPVTRTITIAAEGLTGVQLPEIRFAEVDGLKQYPDKSATENKQGSNGITGVKQIKVAMIPASAGSYTLPEIRLPWWNTTTDRPEVFVIPPTILKATGQAQQSITPATPTAETNAANQAMQTPDAVTSLPPAAQTSAEDPPFWKWLAIFFAATWLVTLLLLLKKSAPSKMQDNTAVKPSDTTLKAATAAVIKQASKNNAGKTRTALIKWAQLFYINDNLTSLSEVSEHCSVQLGQQIRQLNQSMYSPDKTTWHGAELVKLFKQEQQTARTHDGRQHAALKPLYNG